MEQSRLYLTISVVALCAVSSGAYGSITTQFTFSGVSFVGKLALSELIFNFAPAEASSYPFFHRMGHYAKSSEESDEDEEENASHGRIGLQNPQTSQTDQCLAKLLCGMSVAASNKATKPDYYKDYAHLVSRYFQVFGSEDGSIESIEAYDDYSIEDDEPPAPPPPPTTTKSKTPEKFDISLGFTSFLSGITNHTEENDENEPTSSPKAVKHRGAGKLSMLRLARAVRILANLNRQGRKPQPSQCQSLTGCSYSFKQLRAKLKSGTKGKLPTSSSSSGKAPLRYKVHGSQTKPISTFSSNNKESSSEQQFQAYKDPNKGDDEMEEIFGSDAFAPARPKKKKNQEKDVREPPPPPPIYIRRTIIKKKRPSSSSAGSNDDEESASTTIIRVAPSPIQAHQNIPIDIPQADISDDTDEKPKRKVNYKKPPKKTKVKDNGDDEDDDINKTAPIKLVSSDEYNDATNKIYNIENGYQKDVPPANKGASEAIFPPKKITDDDSDEEEDDEDGEDSEEDEENDDEEDEEKESKKKKKIKLPVPRRNKPSIVVEDDDVEIKKKLADDDEVAEAQKDFWGGLTFINRKKQKDEAITKPITNSKYKVGKGKVQSSASNEEESKEDENSKESEENDEKEDDEKGEPGKKKAGNLRGKLDIDIPPSAEHDLAFPSRKKEKVSLKPKADKRKDNKKKDDSSSEEENASFVITEIGGRPLAPPKDPSLKTGTVSAGAGQASPFKLQFISPYPSKQKSSSSYSAPSVYGGNINKAEKLRPAPAPLTSHAFLKSNLPTNVETPVQGKPDMFSRITSLSPISSLTNFFRKGSNPKQDHMQESSAPPASPFMKRPVGPESSKFRRAPSRDKKKKKL